VKAPLQTTRQKTGWDPKPSLNSDDQKNKELFVTLTRIKP